jgi:hypothetical protein
VPLYLYNLDFVVGNAYKLAVGKTSKEESTWEAYA